MVNLAGLARAVVCAVLCTAALAHAQRPPGEPETLEQAWAAALAASARLDAARWEHAAASADLDAAYAQRRPQLMVDSQLGMLSDNPSFLTPGGKFAFQQQEVLRGGASLRIPLDAAGDIARNIDAAASGVASANFDLQRQHLEIKRDVAMAYLRILRLARHVDVARERLKHVSAHMVETRTLFEQGRSPRNDLLAVEVKHSEAEFARLESENELAIARHAYNRQLFRPLDTPIWLSPLEPDRRPFDAQVLTKIALQRRPELAYFQAKADELDNQAAVVSARRKPHLYLDGGWRYDQNRYASPNGIASANLISSWTPFDGGRAERESAALRARASSMRRLGDDVATQIGLQVRTCVVNHQQSLRQLEVARRSVAQAEENLRVVRLQYQHGQANSTDVLDAVAWRAEAHLRPQDALFDTIQWAIYAQYTAGDR